MNRHNQFRRFCHDKRGVFPPALPSFTHEKGPRRIMAAPARSVDWTLGGPGCPVEALGLFDNYVVLRNAEGGVVAINFVRLTRLKVAALFEGNTGYLRQTWPSSCAWGWSFHCFAEALIVAASKKGIVDPAAFGFEVRYE